MAKTKKVDFSSLNAKELIKAAYNEETEKGAVSEIEHRVGAIQVMYAIVYPEDKFKSKGDTQNLNVKSLITSWGNENMEEEAKATIESWLKLYANVMSVFDKAVIA